jgi:hypothetical protein
VGDNRNSQVTSTAKIQQSQNQAVRTLLNDSGKTLVVMGETEKGANQEQTHDPRGACTAAEIRDAIAGGRRQILLRARDDGAGSGARRPCRGPRRLRRRASLSLRR